MGGADAGRSRAGPTLATIAPVVAALLLAGADAARPGPRLETPCWLLPNLRALPTPVSPDCPLQPSDAIQGLRGDGGVRSIADLSDLRRAIEGTRGTIQLEVRSGGRPRRVELPIRTSSPSERVGRVVAAAMTSAFFLALPLSVVWRTASPAGVPLAAFYAAFSVLMVGLLAGRQSPLLTLGSLAALTLAPATLFHLGLRFPRDRPVVVDHPAVCRLPYLAAAFLFALGAIALFHEPLTWPAFVLVLVLLAGLGWVVLIGACGFAMRESTSPLERARSRLVAYGSALLPLVPILALLSVQGFERRDLGVLYLWAAAATMPLPIGLAVSRYNLFDLGLDLRQAIARGLYGAVAALAIAAVLWGAGRAWGVSIPGPGPLVALSVLCALILEPLRRRVPGLLEATLAPRLEAHARLRARFAHELGEASDEEAIVEGLGRVLSEAVDARWGSLFLCHGESPSLAHVFGDPPAHPTRLANDALAALGSDVLLHLASLPERDLDVPTLRAAGVEAAASLRVGRDLVGLVLLGASRAGGPYGGLELDFVVGVSAQAAGAIVRERVRLESLAHERAAAAGRIAIALAHDTGKDVGWLRRLARRLPQLRDSEARWLRDARAIEALAEDLGRSYERIMREASSLRDGHRIAEPRLDDLLARVCQRMARRHGPGRIAEVVEPGLRGQRFPDFLGRAIGNLVDNALRASPAGAPVRVHAALEAGSARISIEDEGRGMSPEIRATAFEPGVSTRLERGGSGVGLTVAAEIAEMLGGSLQLEVPPNGVGTCAVLRVPLGGSETTA